MSGWKHIKLGHWHHTAWGSLTEMKTIARTMASFYIKQVSPSIDTSEKFLCGLFEVFRMSEEAEHWYHPPSTFCFITGAREVRILRPSPTCALDSTTSQVTESIVSHVTTSPCLNPRLLKKECLSCCVFVVKSFVDFSPLFPTGCANTRLRKEPTDTFHILPPKALEKLW